MKNLKIILLSILFCISAYSGSKKPVILIAYHSVTGNTKIMAESVAEGARSVEGVEVKLLKIKQVKKQDILEADAIIVGSPVYNANITPAVQRFINRWPFKDAPLKDKIGAAFVTAGGISAGEELAQMNILHSMLIYNMIVVGGPGWKSAFGASAIVDEEPFKDEEGAKKIKPQFIKKAKALGKRVSRLLKKLKF